MAISRSNLTKGMTPAEIKLREADMYSDNDMPAALAPDASVETDEVVQKRFAANDKLRESYKAKEAKNMKDMKGMKKMAKGGMACGGMKKYAKGGKVRGAGCAKKGVRPCKMV